VRWRHVTCGQGFCCALLSNATLALFNVPPWRNTVCFGAEAFSVLRHASSSHEFMVQDYDLSNNFGVGGVWFGGNASFGGFADNLQAGHSHLCGGFQQQPGRIACWGKVEAPYNLSHHHPSHPTFQGIELASLSTGNGFHACGLAANGSTAKCWGYNQFGQTDVPVDDKTEPPAFLAY
jgi:hypothetical protein